MADAPDLTLFHSEDLENRVADILNRLSELELGKWHYAGSYTVNNVPEDYSIGVTITETGAYVATSGWPYAYSFILTIKVDTTRGWQFTCTSNFSELRVRAINNRTSWYDWRKITIPAAS